MVATTVRLDDDLHRKLAGYCKASGAVQNRVVALALKSWLSETAPTLPVQPHDGQPSPYDGDCGRAPFCEECRDVLRPGWLVAWWRVKDANGRWRKAVPCAACHYDRVRVRRLPRRDVRNAHHDLSRRWQGDAG